MGHGCCVTTAVQCFVNDAGHVLGRKNFAVAGIQEEMQMGFFEPRLVLLSLLTLLLFGGIVAFPGAGAAAADPSRTVMGIVEYVNGTVVTVAGKAYDLKGAPIRDIRGSGPVNLSALRGSTVEILIRNRKIDSVTVYRTLPQ